MISFEESSTTTEEVRVPLGTQGRNVGDRGLPVLALCVRSFGLVLREKKGMREARQVSMSVRRC